MSTRKTIGGALGAIIVLLVAQILAQLVASLFVLVKIPEGICNIIAGIIYVGLAFVLIKLFSKRLLKIKTAFKKRGFLCGYKPLLPARVSRRCFHFVQAIAFDSRQPSKGFIFYYFFLFAFSCLYACCSASENGFAYSFTLILSIAISCISCSRIYFATVASFNPTVLT